MHRISVVGVSGSGKTTVGRALAGRLGVPYVELDALHHGPGWTEASAEELRARVQPLVGGERWVIDGNYRGKLGDLVIARADTVVWLDLPVRVWLVRLARRTFGRMLSREELWNGNREQLRYALNPRYSVVVYAVRGYRKRRRRYASELARFPLLRLRTTAEVERFLRDL
jgi:adenylate kinase family enzyme